MKNQKLTDDNKHISTDEIKQDILDTIQDITNLQREIKGLRIMNDKVSNFKANAKESLIEECREFIKKLEAILKVRKIKI